MLFGIITFWSKVTAPVSLEVKKNYKFKFYSHYAVPSFRGLYY
jgi:hypothetical protein